MSRNSGTIDWTGPESTIVSSIGQIASTTNGHGIFVYDRGGDGDGMFRFCSSRALDFIVRLVGDRYLLNWDGKTEK